LKFKNVPDNVEGSPWRPLLKEKPNALVPLEQSLASLDENGEENREYRLPLSFTDCSSPPNPYQYEIIHSTYPPHLFDTETEPVRPIPLEDNDVIWVDNSKSLASMLKELKKAKEIAVDLEHHDYRSYHGFVCLMQVSTREQDWIVDTLELREELVTLNEVFTDPNIVKVVPFSEDTDTRYFMERDRTSYGCNEISDYTWSTYSIPFMLPTHYNSHLNHSRFYSSNTSISKQIRNTN
jgi:exosome complex exonuclease RRP6